MELGLRDKVAIVTGGSRGIGKACAAALAAEGVKVAISGRDGETLARTANEIRGKGGEVLAVAADAAKAEDNERLVAETVQAFGALHILVNNVGGATSFGAFEELSDEDFLETFRRNVMSTVQVTRAALPHLKSQGWGRIVNISSESGVQPDANMPHYNAAKGALNLLTKSLSKQYARDGILVNIASPAFTLTERARGMVEGAAKSQGVSFEDAIAGFMKTRRPGMLLGRPGTVEEVANVVVFLASEAASFVIGANYRVDGGSMASIN